MGKPAENGSGLSRAGVLTQVNTGEALRADEQAILNYMRAVEGEHRPGILIAFYNGSNWINYERPQARWLPK
jgi:hypothetical protein